MNVGGLAEGGRRGNRSVNQSDLLVRSASAAVLLAVALGAAYLGGIAAGVVAAVFAAVVQLEWAKITGATTTNTLPFVAAVVVAILLAGFGMLTAAIGFAALAALVAGGVSREAWLPAGVVYAAALGIGLLAIRVSDDGLAALIFVLAVVWATDSGAFFFGRLIGGPKLSPRISPKKTWSGAVGGLVTGLLVGLAAARLAGAPVTIGLVLLAAVLSVFCQAGDLFESWVKRRFGAKDSGTIIPGHGGVMDRVDGLVFAAVAAALIGAAHAGASGIGRGILTW